MKHFFTTTFVFIFITGVSYYFFISPQKKDKKSSFEINPLIEVSNFRSNVYRKTFLAETLQYKYGYLEDPNFFIINGGYRWVSFGDLQNSRQASGENLKATFLSSTLSETIAGTQLDDIEFSDGLTLYSGDYELKTDTATYYYEDELFLGTEPVYLTGVDARVHASDGFKYSLKSDDFELFGNVDGLFENVDLLK